MLATQLNSLVHDNKIPQFSVIRVKKLVCNQMAAQAKRVVIVLELEVLQRGEQVGKKIGNPATIGSDGKVPAAAGGSNQNQNPNAGAAAKRPSDAQMGGGAAKVPTQQAQVGGTRLSAYTPSLPTYFTCLHTSHAYILSAHLYT
jgi:hypothetical protein